MIKDNIGSPDSLPAPLLRSIPTVLTRSLEPRRPRPHEMEPDRVCNSRATRVEPHRVRATAYALPEGGHTYGKGCVKDPENAGNGEW